MIQVLIFGVFDLGAVVILRDAARAEVTPAPPIGVRAFVRV